MEIERYLYLYGIDSVLDVLKEALDILAPFSNDMTDNLKAMYLDLKFFKMFFWGLAFEESPKNEGCLSGALGPMVGRIKMLLCGLPYLEESPEEHWRCVLRAMGREFKATLEEVKMHFEQVDSDENWWLNLCTLRNQVQQYKGKAKEICHLALGDGFKSCQNNMFVGDGWNTGTFIDFILDNLSFLHSNTGTSASISRQLSFIGEKLKMFGKFAHIAEALPFRVQRGFDECISQTRTWASCISCLVCLYWIDERDEQLESTMGAMIPDLMQKYMPYTPQVIALYLNMLKATRYQKLPSADLASLVVSYVDFLLEHLVGMHAEDTEILREGMIFLLSFSMDAPNENSDEKRENLVPQIFNAINEIPSVICFPESKLSSFLREIGSQNGVKFKSLVKQQVEIVLMN